MSRNPPQGSPAPQELETAIQDDPLGRLPSASRLCPELHWSDPARGRQVQIVRGDTTLGSSPQVDLNIADRAVSRLHAHLEIKEDGLWLFDLGSQNGTYVEGVRVGSARLDDGARFRVGSTTVYVKYPQEPSVVGLWPVDRFGPLVGRSVAMRELFARLGQAAPSDATLLIQGETGTGKELVARAVHEASPRVNGPFVVVDCGAIHEGLIEAELFGHRRGAFTGASQSRTGSAEAASGGTLFLDEVGELPLALQPKLLRLIETRTVRRVGETQERPVNVRFVAATHRDLKKMVNEGTFREDLYFRLAVLHLTIPPLRERREDIPLLIERFLPEGAIGPAHDLVRELTSQPWRGNVRELRNFVERAVVFGAQEALEPTWAAEAPRALAAGDLPPVSIDRPFKEIRDLWLDYLEREYIKGLLERHDDNVSAVARAAGLNRSYTHRLIRKHRL